MSVHTPPHSQSDQTLDGHCAVVTGAGSGIGRATALRLAHEGAAVFVHSGHRRDRADEVVEAIRKTGVAADSVVCDLSTAQGVDALVEAAFQWSGTIDIWINNAGVDVLTGDVAEEDFNSKLHRLWQVDVAATIGLSRAVGARMRHRGGVIINMGWDQAEWGMSGDSGEMFAAAKGAVMAFSRSLARSLAPHVRVNCVAPGWIRTAWGDQASVEWDRRARGESLLARWGEVDDVAHAIAFLASPQSAFINGQIIPINGGMQPWPKAWDDGDSET